MSPKAISRETSFGSGCTSYEAGWHHSDMQATYENSLGAVLFMQKKDGAQKENNVSAENEKRVNRPELVRKEEPEKDHQKQLEELKESLAQIAAARGESGDRQVHKQQTRKLSPKEEQLINDIISQYLS